MKISKQTPENELRILKRKLDKLLFTEPLNSPRVIELSKSLDKLIVMCYKQDKRN